MGKRKLTEELKEEIDRIVGSLSDLNLYSILGVSPDAGGGEIRKAYFSLAKKFHPDAYFGEELGEYKLKIENIFKGITRAYEVLSNAKRRRKYDEYLKNKRQLQVEENTTYRGLRDVKEKVEEKSSALDSAFVASTKKLISSLEEIISTSLFEKVEGEGEKRFDSSLLRSTEEVHKQWKKKRFSKMLGFEGSSPKAKGDRGKFKTEQARFFIKKIKESIQEGNYLGALDAIKVGLFFDSGNVELRKMMDEVLSKIAPQLGLKYYNMGVNEEEFGDVRSALNSYARAVKYCPDKPEYNYRYALMIFNTGGNLHEAYKYAGKAVAISPEDFRYHLLLAKICMKAGLVATAEKSLKKCLEWEPSNIEVKRLLQSLRQEKSSRV